MIGGKGDKGDASGPPVSILLWVKFTGRTFARL